MELLLQRIADDLTKSNHCAVYEHELTRVWPAGMVNREQTIARFAQEHGLELSYYRQGLCAIFRKSKSRGRKKGLTAQRRR